MDKNSPLDFLLLEGNGALFGDSDVNEVTLPDDDIRSEHEEFGGEGENEEHEEHETPGEEALEHSDEPRDIISELIRELSDLKEKITGKLKDKFPEGSDPEAAEALDDATSAIDLATHHLEDVDNQLSGETEDGSEQELEDGEDVEFHGTASPDVAGPMFDAADKASELSSHGGYEAKLGEARINPIDNAEPLEEINPDDPNFIDNDSPDTQLDIDRVSEYSNELSPSLKSVIQAYLLHGNDWRLIAAELKTTPGRAKRLFDSAVTRLSEITKASQIQRRAVGNDMPRRRELYGKGPVREDSW